MAQNEYIAPVDHGVLSATGSVGVGALGGAAKSFGKTMLWSIGLCAAAGAAIAATLASGGTLGGFTWPVIAGTLGGLGGAVVGLFPGSFIGAFTGLFGGGTGAVEASQRVSQEKGLAKSMQMQMAAYQAQAMAASNDNKYNFPPQGSAMNPAMSQIDASSVDRSGTMVGQQLARA